MQEILEFLNELSHNNQKEWFDENRSRYKNCREKILFIAEMLIQEIRQFDSSIPQMSPKDCVYRINRDIRFSPDKSPYKTNFGIFISPEGRKSKKAGYFLQIEPHSSFAGGGCWMPPSDLLKLIRTNIDQHPEEFREIINLPSFKKHYSSIIGEQLKTAPKGFDKTLDHIDLLRYKSYVVCEDFSDQTLLRNNWIDLIMDAFRELSPMIHFLNSSFPE